MCDASDFAIGTVLGQRIDNKQHVIYYSSRTLNDAQLNYTTTEKEFSAVVFGLEKLHPYLLGSKITIFTDHSALRYLMMKKDAKGPTHSLDPPSLRIRSRDSRQERRRKCRC